MAGISVGLEYGAYAHDEYAPRVHAHEGTILAVAARSLGVRVDQHDMQYWQIGAKAAAALDTLVDEEGHRDIAGMFEQIVSDEPKGIDGVLSDEEAADVADFYRGLPAEQQAAWVDAAMKLPDYADRLADAPTIEKLTAVRLDEAQNMFAKAFMLHVAAQDDAPNRERFNRWLVHFARTSYAIDAALDMPQDYARGVVRVKPTLGNRLHLLRAVRYDIPRSIILGRTTLRETVKTGLDTARERRR